MKGAAKKIGNIFKKYFFTGLVVSAPLLITLIVFGYVFLKLDGILGGLFKYIIGFRIPGLGLLGLVILILLFGFAASSYIGRKLVEFAESVFAKLPIVKTVYTTVKQFQELLRFRKSIVFQSAVLLEYPRKGIFVIGFLANKEPVLVDSKVLYPIFVPTTPNPTSGVLVLMPEDEFTVLDMHIDEAMKLVVSAGILKPYERTYEREKLTAGNADTGGSD